MATWHQSKAQQIHQVWLMKFNFHLRDRHYVKTPPNKESETRAADPMANPLPIAAVVLPAASSPSVLYLTSSPISAISAIPPALSEIGP